LRLLDVHQQQLGEGVGALQQSPGQFLAQEATAAGDDDLHLVILRLVHVQGRYCCVSQPSPSRVPALGLYSQPIQSW
jgi:hypothetical protein